MTTIRLQGRHRRNYGQKRKQKFSTPHLSLVTDTLLPPMNGLLWHILISVPNTAHGCPLVGCGTALPFFSEGKHFIASLGAEEGPKPVHMNWTIQLTGMTMPDYPAQHGLMLYLCHNISGWMLHRKNFQASTLI
jgi:hypothetical protein